MITTLLYPTSGEILYDGMDIYKMGETYRDVIGYLPQHFGYYKNNTPAQYLDYLAALKGISKEAAKEKGRPEGRPHILRKADQAFTLSFSAFATVTLTCLSAGLVIISWVCGLRT